MTKATAVATATALGNKEAAESSQLQVDADSGKLSVAKAIAALERRQSVHPTVGGINKSGD